MEFACVFPGQGSQSVGMVSDFAESFSLVKEYFQEASEVIEIDLWQIVQAGPAELLNQTQNTQPIMLAASYAIWNIWNLSTSKSATVMAGHSFGEVSALTCAQALSFSQAVKLAHIRGQFMQEAVPEGVGAMAAILGMEDSVLEQLCAQVSAGEFSVEAVNYNAPGQVVVAGHAQAIIQLIELAKENGAKRALKLPVSVPAHSSLMRTAAEKFAIALDDVDFNLPSIPVLQNTTMTSPSSIEDMTMALQAQLHSPVPWVNTIHTINAQAECIIEMGPGKVLTGLNKRIDKTIKSVCVFDNASLEQAIKIIEE